MTLVPLALWRLYENCSHAKVFNGWFAAATFAHAFISILDSFFMEVAKGKAQRRHLTSKHNVSFQRFMFAGIHPAIIIVSTSAVDSHLRFVDLAPSFAVKTAQYWLLIRTDCFDFFQTEVRITQLLHSINPAFETVTSMRPQVFKAKPKRATRYCILWHPPLGIWDEMRLVFGVVVTISSTFTSPKTTFAPLFKKTSRLAAPIPVAPPESIR